MNRFLSAGLLLGPALCLSCVTTQANTTVQFDTDLGQFEVLLYDDTTPHTVANFLEYVESGAYNGSVIHRSIGGFIIQGGGFYYDDVAEKIEPIELNPAIPGESQHSNVRGTLAMALVGGDPDSAQSQWFINLSDDNAGLDDLDFTVFGKVINDGMAVVDAIAAVPTRTYMGREDFPLQNYSGGTATEQNLVIVHAVVDLAGLPAEPEETVEPEPEPEDPPAEEDTTTDPAPEDNGTADEPAGEDDTSPTPEPSPAATAGSSGGGALHPLWALLLLLAGLVRRRLRP